MDPQAKPNPATPVMDIAPPVKAPPQEAMATPPPEADTDKPAETKARKTEPAKPKATQPKQASGTGLAIFATIIIVLGLAAMATFAYLKQTNSL